MFFIGRAVKLQKRSLMNGLIFIWAGRVVNTKRARAEKSTIIFIGEIRRGKRNNVAFGEWSDP